MLSSNLQSILTNRLRYLPEITGKAINSIDWPTRLIEIGRTYGLHVDEMEDFQAVVMKAMVGMIQPGKFMDELISTLALSPANAEKVLMEVNDKVFEPIHEYVMNGGATAPDPLKQTGIVMDEHVPTPASDDAIPVPPAPVQQPASQEFEIPPSPEAVPTPVPAKPQVTGSFDDFFVIH